MKLIPHIDNHKRWRRIVFLLVVDDDDVFILVAPFVI